MLKHPVFFSIFCKILSPSDRCEQPEVFDLELDLVRWVKQAVALESPPLMQKPAGQVTQFYGLDSKSRCGDTVNVLIILCHGKLSSTCN